ncbi:AAA family ATPase, partial [Streptomyces flaveolus]|uniref:AAA family ATPase n=1 Tax=Streptomyces flaveolus TaxID=67297 RepID=UPI0034182759
MPVLVITGTGTEVGKTVATAAVAAAALAAGRSVAVLKAAQTGVRPDEPGDAHPAKNCPPSTRKLTIAYGAS